MAERADPDDPHALLQALLREDFGAFLRKAYLSIRGGDALAWNWHLDAIANRLDLIASGASQRLLVTMPPRNLKSIAISVAWVAWMLGKDPQRNFVCVSYSNELSAKLARDCLALMQQGWYRELFPRTILSAKRSASGDFETTAGGGRLATSVTGTLTGRGGDIIIIDDPIKPEEAHSETTRSFVNHWFQSTLASRLNDKATGAIVVVMQRLHQDDLAGTLLETGGWDQLSLPAIAIENELIPLGRGKCKHRWEGEILHPARESREVLLDLKRAMGSVDFEAQYQQQPVPVTGNIIKADWLKTYPASFVPERPGRIVQSWDTATKDNSHADWSVCITAHVRHREVRILDVYRERLEFPALKQNTIRLAREYKIDALLIEEAASGLQLIQTLRSEQPRGMPLPIARRPELDKISRMHGVSGQIEAGQLLVPEDAAWLATFKTELLGFPNARHDDQADALSQLMNWAMQQAEDIQIFFGAPILFVDEGDGYTRQIGGDDDGLLSKWDDDDPSDPW